MHTNTHMQEDIEMVEFLTLVFMLLAFFPWNESTIGLCDYI